MRPKICPHCGAYLDPGEKCDCQDVAATPQHEYEPAGADRTGPDNQNHNYYNAEKEIRNERN